MLLITNTLPVISHGRRSLVGCSPWGLEESDTTERLHFHFSLLRIGEGNGNPLQCSCLKNPRVGVAQSWTRLKWLSSSRSNTKKETFEGYIYIVFLRVRLGLKSCLLSFLHTHTHTHTHTPLKGSKAGLWVQAGCPMKALVLQPWPQPCQCLPSCLPHRFSDLNSCLRFFWKPSIWPLSLYSSWYTTHIQ